MVWYGMVSDSGKPQEILRSLCGFSSYQPILILNSS